MQQPLARKQYYENPDIRKRIIEYLGGTSLKTATCAYSARCDNSSFDAVKAKPIGDLSYYDWGPYWLTCDAATRADFYVRVFSGFYVTGLDDLVDFNCVSTQEKGLCLNNNLKCRLNHFRTLLLERRKHGRLAYGPFNGPFLPTELNVLHFVIHPGPEKEGKPPAEEPFHRIQNASDVLNRVSEYCRKQKMNLILENMLPHLLFGRAGDQWNLGVCLDTGHANLSGDLETVMFKLAGHLKMVHAVDNRGQYDDHLAPGQGFIDWYKLVSKLYHLHYQGGFILELSGDADKSVNELLDDAKTARDFLWNIEKKVEMESSV